jgi:hypothetical protein
LEIAKALPVRAVLVQTIRGREIGLRERPEFGSEDLVQLHPKEGFGMAKNDIPRRASFDFLGANVRTQASTPGPADPRTSDRPAHTAARTLRSR